MTKTLIKNVNLNLTDKDALIIADIQNDFLPKGALGIKNSNQIIPVLNDYIQIFKAANAKIIASKDWHPSNHTSFKAQGGPWPAHCVQDTEGAEFSKDMKLPNNVFVALKATDPNKEEYSVFDATGLSEQLQTWGISRIFIGGLATEYCIMNSVVDAKKMGFETIVLVDAIRGIDVNAGDVDRAFDVMRQKGALQNTLEDFPEPEKLPPEDTPPEFQSEKPLSKLVAKKQARMRSRGSYKQIKRERG